MFECARRKSAAIRKGGQHCRAADEPERPGVNHFAEYVDILRACRGEIDIIVGFDRHVLGEVAVQKKFFEIYWQLPAVADDETVAQIGHLDGRALVHTSLQTFS